MAVVRRTAVPQVHAALVERAGVEIELVQAQALSRIVDSGGMRLSDLAEGLLVACSTAGRHAARLEVRGLSQRTADPADARAVIVRASPAGVELVGRLRTVHAQMLAEALDHWEEEDLTILTTLMSRLGEDLVAMAVGSDPEAGAMGRPAP